MPGARDLRARVNRVFERAHVTGAPRARFVEEQRRRFFLRLLPTIGTLAGVNGVAALLDLVHPRSSESSLVCGLTAIALAALALASTVRRKDVRELFVLAALSSVAVTIGWTLYARFSGADASPFALAPAFGVTVMVLALPLPPWFAPALAGFGMATTLVLCPRTPALAYVIFLFVANAGFFLARTRRKRALRNFQRVERLTRSVARLRKLQEELVVVEKLEALRVLVGGMAHELNNALAVSLVSTEQVVKLTDKPSVDAVAISKAARRAEGGLVRIRQTIERLRRFALAEDAILEFAELSAMLDFALESAIGRARSGVSIERHYASDVGPVACHVSGLAEALFQVAKNAVESMPQGGTIRATVARKGAYVIVSVADEGRGIPPSRLAKVFDPYYMRETTETFTGRVLAPLPGRSGLGLSAVYGLVTSMGGKVEIHSEVGQGTEVSILLPLPRDAQP